MKSTLFEACSTSSIANSEHARVFRAFCLELLERELEPPRHFTRGVALDGVDDGIVDLDVIGHCDQRPGFGGHVSGEIIDHPVANVIEPSSFQNIRRIDRLAQAWREPATDLLPRETFDFIETSLDQRALATLDMVHRFLMHAVADEFPAGIAHRNRRFGVSIDHTGIEAR